MFIEVKPASGGAASEWVIIELQGTVQPLAPPAAAGRAHSIASADRALDGCLMGHVTMLSVSCDAGPCA